MKRKFLLTCTLVLSLFYTESKAQDNDQLLSIMRSELNNQFNELKTKDVKPYEMSYRVIDKKTWMTAAAFGDLIMKDYNQSKVFMPQIRLGSMELDNFTIISSGSQNPMGVLLPIDSKVSDENAIRNIMWQESLDRYNFALEVYRETKLREASKSSTSDQSPSYAKAPVEKHYEAELSGNLANLDMNTWAQRLKVVSAVFNKNKHIVDAQASISYDLERRYFVNTEGTEIVQNLTYARIIVTATIKADDGMEMPLNQSYFGYTDKSLPSLDKMIADAKSMLATLEELRNAPIISPYSCPALLAGEPSGVFFHEIFGHRVEGRRMKNDADGQTFKKMVGEQVLPTMLSVTDDPTLKTLNGEDLNGYYIFDEEGVRSEKVNVVEDGVLKDFLMTRTPIDGFGRSNGHSRAAGGADPVSRQSNLIVTTKDPKSMDELRNLLIKEIKKQNKEFGLYFKEVTGGLTFTGSTSINSFNVTPLVVYKVYADGRADELVRGVDLIGTPLSMFSNIEHAGGETEVFTGLCGASSGNIPVTAISPTILVSKIEVQSKPKNYTPNAIMPSPVANK